MKRLVFCFDGTWNRLDAPCPTNVVLTAESVLPSAEGTAQLIFYDEGVGTDKNETFRGGIFGGGLVKNLADGYRFLIFNYSPGDEIYVFGFSRGAYTARSFVGLLNTCGIISRKYASKVNDAIELYKQRDTSDDYKENMRCFRRDYSPDVCITDEEAEWRAKTLGAFGTPTRLEIAYLGVWDTVGALGIPGRYKWLSFLNKKHNFHDTNLSAFVKSARHAVAIDERRMDFAPTLWTNFAELNTQRNADAKAPEAPYQQVWFPGVHGAVGGGGERRGLSDASLEWIWDGARYAGLVLDGGPFSRAFDNHPDYKDHIENSDTQGLMYIIMNRFMAADRSPGPASLLEISPGAKRKWLENPEHLKDKKAYRPGTLAPLKTDLDALDPALFGLANSVDKAQPFQLYIVQKHDGLRKIARDYYGDAEKFRDILQFNLDKIDNQDRIYPKQQLRLPIAGMLPEKLIVTN